MLIGTTYAFCDLDLDLINRILRFTSIMVRRKTVKPRASGPKNITTGLCPKCGTIGKILIIGVIGSEKGKCQACNGEFDL